MLAVITVRHFGITQLFPGVVAIPSWKRTTKSGGDDHRLLSDTDKRNRCSAIWTNKEPRGLSGGKTEEYCHERR
jgi:hypothetical protein